MLRFINLNKRTIWNMEFGMEIGIQHYRNTVCKFRRCFDLSLSLWRLFVDGKMLGVLKLDFFSEIFATKRLFFSDSTRVLCLCKRFFGSSLKSIVREMDADDRKHLCSAYMVCCTSFFLWLDYWRCLAQSARRAGSSARSVTSYCSPHDSRCHSECPRSVKYGYCIFDRYFKCNENGI